jgi:hypothetical protein
MHPSQLQLAPSQFMVGHEYLWKKPIPFSVAVQACGRTIF